MTFLPIVGRELRVAARQRAAHGARVAAALGAILVGGWILLVPPLATPQRLGSMLFLWLSIVAFAYCLFVGLFTTADCLSREKRDGTFGLLFLTDLRGYDVVLGKLAASSLHALYGLVAIFPVMAISVLAGGVAANELIRMVLVLLNTLFFSLTAGLLFSAICRDERKSGLLTTLVVVGFTGGLPLLGTIIAASNNAPRLGAGFFIPSAGYSFVMAFEGARTAFKQFNYFQGSLAFVHGLSWLMLIAACFIVPRIWQDRTEFAGAAKPVSARGFSGDGFLMRAGHLRINPVYWLTSRERLRPVLIWSFLGLLGLAWLWGWARFPNDWNDAPVMLFTALSLHTVLKIWMAAAAAKRFNEDHQSGALELLLVTPLSVGEIVHGHLRALKSHFIGPVLFVLAADCAFIAAESSNEDWVVACLAGITVFVLDMFTLAWVGTWLGLKSKSALKAVGATVARILVLPWLLFLAVMTAVAVLDIPAPGNGEQVMTGIWFLISLTINAVFGLRAARGLKHEFRRAAARRFEPARSRGWLRWKRSEKLPAGESAG